MLQLSQLEDPSDPSAHSFAFDGTKSPVPLPAGSDVSFGFHRTTWDTSLAPAVSQPAILQNVVIAVVGLINHAVTAVKVLPEMALNTANKRTQALCNYQRALRESKRESKRGYGSSL
jgi:hypothetical protein